jgi:hypothetical protein
MDKIEELKSKIRENSLVISRVPKKTKEEFIALANAEFCGDYGMELREVFNDAKLLRKIKEMLFENKLKLIFEK